MKFMKKLLLFNSAALAATVGISYLGYKMLSEQDSKAKLQAKELEDYNNCFSKVASAVFEDLSASFSENPVLLESGVFGGVSYNPTEITIEHAVNYSSDADSEIVLCITGLLSGSNLKGESLSFPNSGVTYQITEEDFEKIIEQTSADFETIELSEDTADGAGEVHLFSNAAFGDPFTLKEGDEIPAKTALLELIYSAIENGQVKEVNVGEKLINEAHQALKLINISAPTSKNGKLSYALTFALYDRNNLNEGGKIINVTLSCPASYGPMHIYNENVVEQIRSALLGECDFSISEEITVDCNEIKLEDSAKFFSIVDKLEEDKLSNYSSALEEQLQPNA